MSQNQLVTQPMNGKDVFRMGGIIFDFLPELQDEVVHSAGAHGFIISPNIGQELVAADGLVSVLPEELENFKFLRRHLNTLAISRRVVCLEINIH